MTRKFVEVVKRSAEVDHTAVDLNTAPHWRMALGYLYLCKGRAIPPEAKHARRIVFGFCNEAGEQLVEIGEATHFGWTVEDYDGAPKEAGGEPSSGEDARPGA